MKKKSMLAVIVSIALFAALAGCSSSGIPSVPGAKKELTILAAANLTEAFNELQKTFEQKNPEILLHISFAGSQILRTQIEQGAPADVFVSANESHMKALKEEGLVNEYQLFAKNKLVLIVPASNPADINSLEDLGMKEKFRWVIGVENVPIGQYARKVLDNASKVYGADFTKRVMDNTVSLETDVKKVAGKVALGEADAGMVYVTDITDSMSPKLKIINIPDELNVIAEQTIATVKSTHLPDEAQKWVDFVLSPDGQSILAKHHQIPVKP